MAPLDIMCSAPHKSFGNAVTQGRRLFAALGGGHAHLYYSSCRGRGTHDPSVGAATVMMVYAHHSKLFPSSMAPGSVRALNAQQRTTPRVTRRATAEIAIMVIRISGSGHPWCHAPSACNIDEKQALGKGTRGWGRVGAAGGGLVSQKTDAVSSRWSVGR